MILGIDGKRIAGARSESGRDIEIVRSFSYKLNLKLSDGSPAYEDCQFFCSKKDYSDREDAHELSRDLFEFCMDEVLEDIKIFQERRAKRQATRARSAA
jgi:hypothetical protein